MKTEEEKAALKAKYAAENAAKQAIREQKKAKFSETNAKENMPTVVMRVPIYIDLEKPPWTDYLDAKEHNYRFDVWLNSGKWPDYEVRRKIIRT